MKRFNLKLAALGLVLSFNGAAFAVEDPLVLVQRVTGIDDRGVERVLFEDRGGVVSRLSALPEVVSLIDARRVERLGTYREIKVEVAPGAFETGAHGMAAARPVDRVVELEGTLVVKRNRVESGDLALHPEEESVHLNRREAAGRVG